MSQEVLGVSVEAELDAFLGQYVVAEQAPGLVYGITGPGGLGHTRGFGRYGKDDEAPDEDTVFPIASMSKSFSACAALIARDRGLISLEDPIDKWVPEFRLSRNGTPADGMPTLGMLLSMSGGLTEDNSWVDPFIDLPTEVMLGIVEAGVRLSRQPGAAFEYSNLGFTLACLAVSRAVGMPFEDFIHNEIAVPLGLTSTWADNGVPAELVRAVGHSLDLDGHWAPFGPKQSDAFLGAGGMVSSVRDLAHWITWLGAAFRPATGGGDDAVLSRMSRRELQRIRIPVEPTVVIGPGGGVSTDISGYCLGLVSTLDANRGTYVHHSGGLPGFLLHMRWHPQSGRGIVVLTNSHRGDPVTMAAEALARALARDQVASGTVALWSETVELCAKTEALIRDWSDSLAAQVFADNVDFDRPLSERRREIESLVETIGPLYDVRPQPDVVSAVTPADITWSIPGENGELICMIHLTPVDPAQVQEIVVRACPRGMPRAARPTDISPRRSRWGDTFVSPITKLEVQL